MTHEPETTADSPVWSTETLDDPHAAPDKAQRVQQMFNGIAPGYDRINSIFSAGRDAKWRRRAVQLANIHDNDTVLDIACGTGNLTRALAGACPRLVIGLDFAHEMLVRAANPFSPVSAHVLRPSSPVEQGATALGWCEADALQLPFAAQQFSIISCAFGIRNFSDLDTGLAEMYRVLKPGGRVVILEFSRPRNPVARRFYEFYANRIMPVAASLISRDKTGAYRYLPQSVVSFAQPDEITERLKQVGFTQTTMTSMTMGVVTIITARRD